MDPQLDPQQIPLEPGEQVVIINPEKIALVAKRNSGASWLTTVGFFAVVNSLLIFADIKIRFIFALGITYLVSAVAVFSNIGAVATGVALLFSCLGAAGAYFFARMARGGHSWAFITAMVLYGLDALLWVWLQDWIEVAAHSYALWKIYEGLQANNEYRRRFPNG